MKEFSKTYYLSAGECNPQAELPLPLLMNRVIDIATLHANSWGVGYARLIADGHAWVLARVAIEMERYPRVNEYYTLTTWVEDYNRMFSQRHMMVTDANGEVMGYVRTIWMVIDLATRQSVDISQLTYIRDNISPRRCPIAPQGKLRPFLPATSVDHTFGYAECDFNRHVNTVRYLELMLNQFTLDYFDSHQVQRLEVAFIHETRYAQQAQILKAEETPDNWRLAIVVDGEDHVRARFLFKKRGNEELGIRNEE